MRKIDIPYVRDDQVVTRDQFDATTRKVPRRRERRKAAAVPGIADAYSRHLGLRSLGLGCMRKQVAEFNAFYRDAGITGAHHDPDGTLVIESRQARNQVLALRNLRDNDAGYGDHAGRH